MRGSGTEGGPATHRVAGKPAAQGNLALFAAACAVILVAAFLFRGGDQTPPSAGPGEAAALRELSPPPSTAALVATLQRRRLELEASARRFLTAFFRYEVGETGAAVRRALWTTSTGSFYRQLLRRPVAPPRGGFPARASLVRLQVSFVSANASRALISGTAMRRGLPEEFAFVFTLGPAGWLASAPGE